MFPRSEADALKIEALMIMIKCYNNLAACILNGAHRTQGDFMRAVGYCDKVREIDSVFLLTACPVQVTAAIVVSKMGSSRLSRLLLSEKGEQRMLTNLASDPELNVMIWKNR